jgi:hypothetical protein
MKYKAGYFIGYLIGTLQIISLFGFWGSLIWAIVDFIIYLMNLNTHSFNWWSIWSTLICAFVFVYIVSYINKIKRKSTFVK